jgi:hypothetical protein
MARKMPRPTIFDPRVADAVIQRVAGGECVEAACRAVGLVRTTFGGWVRKDPGGLQGRLAAAKAAQVAPAAKKSPTIRPPAAKRQARPALHWTCEYRIELGPEAAQFVASLGKSLLEKLENPAGRPAKGGF